MTRKPFYQEGSWFLMPVGETLWAAGIITRVSKTARSTLLGYFFDDLYSEPPSLEYLCTLRAQDAGMVMLFGPLGFKRGGWQSVGRCLDWKASNWPTPTFVRANPLTEWRYEVWLDDKNPNQIIGEKLMASDDGRNLEPFVMSGYMAVQIKMAKRLGLPLSFFEKK